VQTFDDVARLVAELPELTEGEERHRGHRAWHVAGKDAFFTIAHFNGYNAYLVKLDQVTVQDLKEALVDGWLAMAPPQVAEGFGEQVARAPAHPAHPARLPAALLLAAVARPRPPPR
jgi:hypothetical protein